jgi:hypothetical protein
MMWSIFSYASTLSVVRFLLRPLVHFSIRLFSYCWALRIFTYFGYQFYIRYIFCKYSLWKCLSLVQAPVPQKRKNVYPLLIYFIICKYFLPVCGWVSILLTMPFIEQNILILMNSTVSVLSFMDCGFDISKKSSPYPTSCRFSPMLFSRSYSFAFHI